MNQNFYEAVEDNPIIAAVKSMEDVEECCKHDDIRVIFILFGDVCSIGSIVKTIRDAGKIAMVHMDLISGLSPKEIAVEFIKEQTEADGIISTKPSLIKKAHDKTRFYRGTSGSNAKDHCTDQSFGKSTHYCGRADHR